MIFYVAGGKIRSMFALKFRKKVKRIFSHDIDKHIQSSPVGHADDDFLHPGLAGALDQFIHGGNKAFPPFKREAFLADKTGMEIALKSFSSS